MPLTTSPIARPARRLRPGAGARVALLALMAAGLLGATQAADPKSQANSPGDAGAGKTPAEPRGRILIFSKTAGFRHDSIPDGIACLRELLSNRYDVDASEDSSVFTEENLARYKTVVFLSTTGDILNDAQQRAFESFIRRGGGFAGVHAAADTEHTWPWYGQLVGAYFKTHPEIQESLVRVEDRSHPSTVMLPGEWRRTDEWYVYTSNPRSRVRVLASLDATTIKGVSMGEDHPIAWFHVFEGGRSWYTGGGHTKESFKEPLFRAHLEGGVLWAAGDAEIIEAPERGPEAAPATPAPQTKPHAQQAP